MEIEEVKKVSRYDAYTVNEFVKGLVKAREDIKIAKDELDIRANNVSAKLLDVEHEMSEEELNKNAEEIENIKQERKIIEEVIPKWQEEKERILAKLSKNKEKNENEILERKQKIKKLEDDIKLNEEEMSKLDPKSKEYGELKRKNNKNNKKVSRTKRVIARYEKKRDNITDIIENLEAENIIDGLTPLKAIGIAKLPEKSIRKINNEKKEVNEEITEKEEVINNEKAKEIAGLEEQIRNSAQRMKECKENGDYEQEAEEHAYYNKLISKLNSLKTKVEQPAKTTKTVETKVEQPAKTTKTTETKVEQPAKTTKTVETKIEQPAKTTKTAETKVEEPVQTEPSKSEQTTKKEVQWNSKLTPEQIEELIADGIEPGDNEYNLYLWNHGINPFESQMKAKTTQKIEVDEILQKYENDGFGKNAFGWYFNPWTSEYEKDYDPHNDPEYNDKMKRESTITKKIKVEEEIPTEEPKKLSLKQKIKNLFNKIKDTLKRYIANFNNEQLPEGKDEQTQDLSEQEKAEYVAKANEVLEETLSTESVLSQNTRRAMEDRNKFVSKFHISDDLRQKIEKDEQPKTEEIDQEER